MFSLLVHTIAGRAVKARKGIQLHTKRAESKLLQFLDNTEDPKATRKPLALTNELNSKKSTIFLIASK